MDYDGNLICEVIRNRDLIESFLERTTNELFPTYYILGGDSNYYQQEGHTLEDGNPHNTRVPSRDSLKENLMVLLADIDRALGQLSLEDRLAVIYYLTIYEGRKDGRPQATAMLAIEKMAAFLNGNN